MNRPGGSCSGSFEVLPLHLPLGNGGGGVDFQASQCISMDLAAAARSVHTLTIEVSLFSVDDFVKFDEIDEKLLLHTK